MPKAAHPTKLRDRWRIRWIDEHDERQSAVFDTYKEAEYQLGAGGRVVEADIGMSLEPALQSFARRTFATVAFVNFTLAPMSRVDQRPYPAGGGDITSDTMRSTCSGVTA